MLGWIAAAVGGGNAVPVLRLTNGTVSGALKGGVEVYLGVPYAAAPVGELRFAPPAAHPGWFGTRDGTAAGSACVQGGGPAPGPSPGCKAYCSAHHFAEDMCGCGVCGSFGGCTWSCDAAHSSAAHPLHKCPAWEAAAAGGGSEDCLFVNVFRPQGASQAPVMFYVHGGGFVAGEATTAGHNLANLTGHVIVAIQYRLSTFGFLSPDAPPTNFGLQDQRFALKWVHDNAVALGADPRRILIFGCSAGGASVAGMLVHRPLDGLYSAAGIESPGGHQGWMAGPVRSDDDWMSPTLNLNNSHFVATAVGCESAADLACLRRVESDKLYSAGRKRRLAPALATEGAYPLGQIRRGNWSRVPVIVGGQSCESCGGAAALLGPYSRNDVTEDQLRAALIKAGLSGQNGSAVGPDQLLVWYGPRIAAEGRWRTLARILSDSGHACSSTLHGEALGSTSSSVWRYYFAYAPTGQGARHGGDESWLLDDRAVASPEEWGLSEDMARWWASLASSGDPNAAATHNAPLWTSYSPSSTDVMFMGEGKSPEPFLNATADTRRAECEHWKAWLGW